MAKASPQRMRYAHNVRLTSHSKSQEEREALKHAYQEWLGTELAFEEEDLTEEGFATLFGLKLWLDRQQPVRKVLTLLLQGLSDEDVRTLQEQAESRIDERGNFYFRIDKQAFLNNKTMLVERGDVIQVRINPAAYPANTENALAVVQSLLAARQA